jgi:hypothetical protein
MTAVKTNKVFDSIVKSKIFSPDFMESIKEVREEESVVQVYVDMIVKGHKRHGALIGAPGLGKSYSVVTALKKARLTEGEDYIVLTGKCSPREFFNVLQDFDAPGKFVVIDDCSIEQDVTALGLLRSATDKNNNYLVRWETTRVYERPSSFNFRGSIIFCANIFEGSGRGVKSATIDAVLSRLQPKELAWDTTQMKFAQIFNMVVYADYLSSESASTLNIAQKIELLTFMRDNKDKFRKLDLRLPFDCALYMNQHPTRWKSLIRSIHCGKVR